MSFWQAAYRNHGSAVLGYLTSRLGREDAEDVLQETFVRAIKASDTSSEPTRLRPYLLTIAHNLMVNTYRKKRPMAFSETTAPESFEDRPGLETSPLDSVNLHQLEDRVESCIEEMTSDQRLAFELAVLGGTPYKDIARKTGWSLAKVKVTVYRSRQRAISNLREFVDPLSGHAGTEHSLSVDQGGEHPRTSPASKRRVTRDELESASM